MCIRDSKETEATNAPFTLARPRPRSQLNRDDGPGTRAVGLEIPPKGPQPPSDPARQEERRRNQHPLEIQLPELGRITHPVILNHRPSRIRDQPLEGQNKHCLLYTSPSPRD